MDLKVARFIKNFSLPEREAVHADIERYEGRSLEDLGREITAVCRMAAEILHSSPQQKRILELREPPHKSYFELIRRFKSQDSTSFSQVS